MRALVPLAVQQLIVLFTAILLPTAAYADAGDLDQHFGDCDGVVVSDFGPGTYLEGDRIKRSEGDK